MQDRTRRIAALAVLAGGAACSEVPTAAAPSPPVAPTTLGLVEITVTGIGTPELRASAGAPEPSSREGLRQSLTPVAEAGRSGIQLRAVSSGTFTFGPRGVPGSFRYIFVTFEVRNASSNGTAYTTPRQNLTFVAVSTSSR